MVERGTGSVGMEGQDECNDQVKKLLTGHPLTTHTCAVQGCSQARNTSHALGSSHTDCSVIFVHLKRICHLVLHMCVTLYCSLTCRSCTLPSTTTQEHEEHQVHLNQDLPVDKQRHQESLWRENLPAGWRKPAQGYSHRKQKMMDRNASPIE